MPKLHASLVAAILAVPVFAFADAPTTTTVPSTEPTTGAAATDDKAEALTLDGYLAPRDPFEVKLALKGFQGELKPTQVVGFGSPVKQGESLVSFDTTELDDSILSATSELDVANANLTKAQADIALGDRADAAGLEEHTDAVHDAQVNLDWWKKKEGPDFLAQLDLQLKSMEYGVDDQKDELDQLRKMYHSESLTNATADIVVKRAVRQLEIGQQSLAIQQDSTQKGKETSYVDKQQEFERGLTNAQRELDSFNATAAQGRVTRTAGLTAAQVAQRAAQRKLSDLEKDKAALAVTTPHEGVVFFGGFGDDGTWRNAKPDAIKTGQKVDPNATLFTVVQPGHVTTIAKATDEQLPKLKVGAAVKVKVAAVGDDSIDGTIKLISPLPAADGTYQVTIDLARQDAKLMPGMKAKIEVAK